MRFLALAFGLTLASAHAIGASGEGASTVVLEIRSYTLRPGELERFGQRFVDEALLLLRQWNIDVVAYGPSLADRDSYVLMRAAHFTERLRLADVGRAVGASPAYLTDVFRRFEGIPLHRYLTQLRLARALVELPHANDLTALAFDLGFSSHSHFTLAFRRTYGCTPSDFRGTVRRRDDASAPQRIRA